jgi:DNA-binding NtrC family response regulator
VTYTPSHLPKSSQAAEARLFKSVRHSRVGFYRFAQKAVLERAKVKTSVLYFDDEPVLLDVFKDMFTDEYDVLTASTLREARPILSQCPDIIISDWNMPGISGVDFLREAARTCPDGYRIMLTGYGQVGDVFTEISTGVIQLFITKPWDEADMREVLERATLMRAHSRDRSREGARWRSPVL